MERIEERLARIEERLQSLVEINNRLVHENIRKSKLEPITQQIFQPNNQQSNQSPPQSGIVIETHTHESFRVSGKTYPHRNLLREAKGEWDKTEMCWVFHIDNKEKLVGLFKENNIEFTHC